MYEAYYRLTAKPFQLSPDPRFFFSSRGHQRAMAYLVYGAHQAEGFIVITGEVGAGKTLLARVLAEKLEARMNPVLAHVVSTQLGSEDTVRIVAGAFGLPVEGSKAVLLRNIEQFLLGCRKQGRRALLLIDEAQNLPLDSVEELRMLSNFQSGNKALLQSFLLGQPEFRRMLQSHALEQLRQRVIASCHIGPMDASETERYIRHRLDTAGWRGDPAFADGAYLSVHRYTGGIPRRINVLCDRLMLLGRLDEKHLFDSGDVAEVAEELRLQFSSPVLQPEAGVAG
jgi:putative secretion ATPase (PEP-CTERM system associated)